MKVVWLALVACAACKGETKEEHAVPAPVKTVEPEPARPAAARPAPAPVASTPPPAPARAPAQPSVPAGAHPDYPTAAAAGTEKIFFLEEPDRGPKAPASFARPKDLTWTRAPYCETYEKTVACGAGTGDWYIGKRKGLMIVERRRGSATDVSKVYVYGSDGKITQRLTVDHTGAVTSAYLFTQPGRYTGRERDGGNALDGCGMMAYVDDKQGRVVESRCLQWLGEPMRDTSGVAITKYVLDQRGLNKEWAYYGIDGEPVDSTSGVHRVVVARDGAGRVVLRQQYSRFGVRMIDTAGCAGSKYEYDAAGRLTASTCLDTVDKPVANEDGIVTTSYRYDAAGCVTANRYFDRKGANAADAYGVHGRDFVVDAHCDKLVETCLGADERTHACSPSEPARMSYTRDSRGRTTSVKHFDAAGAPAFDGSYRVFELRYKVDDFDHFTEMSCFDKDSTPVECGNTGMHSWREEFDDAGHEIAQTYTSTTGEPASNLGIFKRTFRYDNYDHEHESRALGKDGTPVESRGMAVRTNLWDSTHRLFAVLLYDLAGKPARYTACYTGVTCPKGAWHAVRINRRGDGTVLTNQFFDAGGKLVATIDCTTEPCFDDD